MKRALPLVLLFSCATPKLTIEEPIPVTPVTQPSEVAPSEAQPGASLAPQAPDDEELRSMVRSSLYYPCSIGPKFENDSSVKYVIDHIEQTHPILLEMLEANDIHGDIRRAFRILVIAGKEESVPVMEKILLSDHELDAPDAGAYLGLHPSKKAFNSLLKGLLSDQTHTVFGATLGLMERKDLAACEPLRREMNREDDSQRYYVIQAAGELGCLSVGELKKIAKSDSSKDIRNKASKMARGDND